MKAKEILELPSDHPIRRTFQKFLKKAKPTKRKAREFLRSNLYRSLTTVRS